MGRIPGRKRGGQPGNHNALRNGVYGKIFTIEQARTFEEMGRDLEGEIALLRTHINGLAAKLEGTDYGETALAQLYCMGTLIVKAAFVIRTQAWLTGQISPTAKSAVNAILMNRDDWEEVEP